MGGSGELGEGRSLRVRVVCVKGKGLDSGVFRKFFEMLAPLELTEFVVWKTFCRK